jgi:putative membrane-bound dehydrogenase-like protein
MRHLLFSLGVLAMTSLTAFAGPVRVIYFDPQSLEQSKVGPLHAAMRDLGRDAIYFDYVSEESTLTEAFVRHYDVILQRSGAAPAGLKTQVVKEGDTPEQIKSLVLASLTKERHTDWQTFLAQREPEKREKHPMVANYEKRPEALTFQLPMNVKGSMERTQVPADCKVEVFASEPEIGKPIALAWDARGRCWVAETSDYPHGVKPDGVGSDRIKICEDTDGDGKADKFTIFAEGLNIPTALVFANGGLIVSQPPQFLFLKDTDGDDKADIRQPIMTGWGIRDTHAQASSLHYGYDNWLQGCVGYSAFEGEIDGVKKSFTMGTYRFKADGSALEFLHQFTNNSWGQSQNSAGDDFGGTANGAPLFFGGIPASLVPQGQRIMTAKKINVVDTVHTITPNFRQVDVFGGYTAAAGSSFIYSDKLPQRFQGKAMVCEPTMKIVALMDVQPEGAGYKALDSFNLFASSDEWNSPVFAEVGPDGAVWVADFQNFIIQHNPTPTMDRGGFAGKTGIGGAHENDLRDHSRGRIYRITAKTTAAKPHDISGDLVAALSGSTQQERLTAQRLLIETKATGEQKGLEKLVTANDGNIAAIHALWALQGLKVLDESIHKAALLAKDAKLRRNAIRALGSDEKAASLLYGAGVVTDPDLATRLAAFVKLAELPTTENLQTLVKKLAADPVVKGDEWLAEAVKLLGVKHKALNYHEGPNLLPNPGFESLAANGLPEGWSRRDYNKQPGTTGAEWKSVSAEGLTHSGKFAFRVITRDDADTSFFADVSLKPNTDYKLRAWIKTHGFKGKASLNDHLGRAETDQIKRTSDWSVVETTFNSKDRDKASINLLHVGKGDAYFDDVSLVEMIPDIEEDDGKLAGDVARGEKVFWTHPVAACMNCHMLGGKGSAVGPAMDGIASRKDEAYITESLLNPNARLAEGYTATPISPMPPMNLILKPQELADIKAFLLSLKTTDH